MKTGPAIRSLILGHELYWLDSRAELERAESVTSCASVRVAALRALEDSEAEAVEIYDQLEGKRIYPQRIPQNEVKPAIAYQKISALGNDSKTGASKVDDERWQLVCYGPEYDTVTELMDKVRWALDHFSGDVDGVELQGVQFLDSRDQFDNDGEVHGVSADFQFRVVQPIPA